MILAPKGMKKLLYIKNTRYDLRGTDILKLKLKTWGQHRNLQTFPSGICHQSHTELLELLKPLFLGL